MFSIVSTFAAENCLLLPVPAPSTHCHGDGGTIPSRTQRAGPLDLCPRTTSHAKGVLIFTGPVETWWNSREDF